MNFKGMPQLRAHVPDLRTRLGMLVIGLIALFFISLASAILLIIDHLCPGLTLVGQVGMLATGFLLVSQFFWRKETSLIRWGEAAYRNAFGHFVLTGLPLIFAVVAHIAYMPGPPLPVNWWTPGIITLGWLFFILGAVLLIRTIFTFGADNLAMLYVYFPQEGHVIESSIYAILRHPVYAGITRIGIGLSLLNSNWFALAFALFMPFGLTLWLRLVEERELLDRFGQGYAGYRARVPAFWPRLRDWGRLLRFMVSGE